MRQRVLPCWNFDANAAGADGIIVEIRATMNRDGTVADAEVANAGQYPGNSVYRSASESARRAILNPRCQPLPLPADRYDEWRDILFVFDPRDL